MKRIAFLILILAAAAPAHAFDKDRLVQHLRENLSLDTRTEIVVQGEPVPSGISDLKKVQVLIAGAPYDVLLTKDEKRYIWGLTADLSNSPDATRAKAFASDRGHAVGLATAPVTVVEFSDLECSYCKKGHEILAENLYKTYTPAQVRWVFKQFPLNSHPWSIPAGSVADCAAQQDETAFWKISDFYFKNQEKITEKDAVSKGLSEAKRLGLNVDAIKTCMDDPKTKENILEQKKEGTAAGVSSTPTVFVNGRMRRGFRDFEDIKVLIEEKLKSAR